MVTKKGEFKGWFINHVQLPGNHHLPYFVQEDALDLLHQIFRAERKRISVKNALKHKFFIGTNGKPAETTVDMKALATEIKLWN